MKNSSFIRIVALAMTLIPTVASAQTEALTLPSDPGKHDAIAVSRDTITVGYDNGVAQLSVLARNGFTVETADTASFFTATTTQDDQVLLSFGYNYKSSSRTGSILLEAPDGFSREVVAVQEGNNSAEELTGDFKLEISSATASSSQSGEGIEYSYDGDVSTIYHSSWSATSFPVTLNYVLTEAAHVDYLIYTPRQSGSNGNFGEIEVWYSLASAPTTFIQLLETDLGESSSASVVSFGADGIDNVKRVRIVVNSGYNNFASCAEMAFYQHNTELQEEISTYFTNNLCTTLRFDVTAETASTISTPYIKQLVYTLLDGDYDTDYRLGEYEAYETLSTLSSRQKTTNYNAYENPTGIYFTEGKTIVAFVDGLEDQSISLIIKNFGQAYDGESQDQSSYALMNGVNVITPTNRGNGYVSYYTDDYATAPNVKIHFAMADVNGYFDLERGDTNDDWIEMLANACSDIMDVRTKRLQVAFPTARFKEYCPKNAVELANNFDSVVYREREEMGLILYNSEPKNRQFARVIWSSSMYADAIGAAAGDNLISGWMQPDPDDFEFWGFAHELGHVNQLSPSFKWSGCGETTNNVYSAWVQFVLGAGYLRLEHEVTGIDDYSSTKGGRFNTYLEEGVRKGVCWQLQDGPDYNGTEASTVSVRDEDYDGTTGSYVTTTSRNYDHFVKLAPLWQLQLYCHQCGFAPNVYAKVMESLRNADDNGMTNGMQQMRFMRLVCDSTGLNFLPFFEKAGMLKPISAYIEDYSAGWLKISEDMISELKAYVAEQGYPEPEGEVNYITGNNWEAYANRADLVGGELNEGCTLQSSSWVKVLHSVWQNAVAFETYDAEGNLLRISMQGLGGDSNNTYTRVMWPQTTSETAAYIMAVGWDGTRIKCYEP